MKAANTINVNPDGYVEINVVGDQNYLTYDKLRQDLKPVLEERRVNHQEMLGLVDFGRIGTWEPTSIKAGFELLGEIPYKKVALISSSAALNAVVEGIILAIGRGGDTKIFADRAAAVDWLLR